ncbi:hypothetical protein [Streptomyces sp. NPDC055681]
MSVLVTQLARLDAGQFTDQYLGQCQLPVRDRSRHGQATGLAFLFPQQGLDDEHAVTRPQHGQAFPAVA